MLYANKNLCSFFYTRQIHEDKKTRRQEDKKTRRQEGDQEFYLQSMQCGLTHVCPVATARS